MSQELSPEQLDRLEREPERYLEAVNATLARAGEPPATMEELRALAGDGAEAIAAERRCPHCGGALP